MANPAGKRSRSSVLRGTTSGGFDASGDAKGGGRSAKCISVWPAEIVRGGDADDDAEAVTAGGLPQAPPDAASAMANTEARPRVRGSRGMKGREASIAVTPRVAGEVSGSVTFHGPS
jgi:hypothetical protein